MDNENKTTAVNDSSEILSVFHIETVQTAEEKSEVSATDLAKSWAEFDPRVPLSYLIASKKAARLKNAY